MKSAIIAETALFLCVALVAVAADQHAAAGAVLAVRKTRTAHIVARAAVRPVSRIVARLGLWSALAGIVAVLLSPRDASFHRRASIACVLSCAAIACESYAEPVEPVEFTDDEEEEEIDD
jgi:hypothetical protein